MSNMDVVFDKSIEDNEMYELIFDDAEDTVFEHIFGKDVDAFVESADDTDDSFLNDEEDEYDSDLENNGVGDTAECKECNECGDENKAEGTDTNFSSIKDEVDIKDVAPAEDEEYNDNHTPDIDLEDKIDFSDLFKECGDENKAEGTDTKFSSIDDDIDIDDVAPAEDEEYNDTHTPDVELECGDENKAEGTDTKFSSIDDDIDIDDVAPAADDEYNDSHTPDIDKVDFDKNSISESECEDCGDENKAEGTDTKFSSIDDDIDIDDVAPAEDEEYNDSHTPDVDLDEAAEEEIDTSDLDGQDDAELLDTDSYEEAGDIDAIDDEDDELIDKVESDDGNIDLSYKPEEDDAIIASLEAFL